MLKVKEGDQRALIETAVSDHCKEYIRLFPIPLDDNSELQREVRQSGIGSYNGTDRNIHAYWADRKLDGEAMAAPRYRIPAFQHDRYVATIGALFLARSGGPEGSAENGPPGLKQNEIVFSFDGDRLGNHDKITEPWMKRGPPEEEEGQKKKRKVAYCSDEERVKFTRVVVSKDEESMRASKVLTRSLMGLEGQNETMLVGKLSSTILPEGSGLTMEGSNRGQSIQDVPVVPDQEVWLDTWKSKKKMYGSFRVNTDKQDADEPKTTAIRKDSDIELCFFPVMSNSFCHEVLHRFYISSISDLYIGAGMLAYLSAQQRVFYFGLAMTPYHAQVVERRVKMLLVKDMYQIGSSLYDKSVHAALKGVLEDDDKVFFEKPTSAVAEKAPRSSPIS